MKKVSLVCFACVWAVVLKGTEPQQGIADRFPGDRGLEKDPAVLVVTDFESDGWRNIWSGGKRKTVQVIETDPERSFQPLTKKALRIRIDKGGHYGANLRYYFQRHTGSEPEEIYFRYYLRFADDWDPQKGGKLPGFGGTYERGGWGGRTSDGKNGWSARGQFNGVKDGKTPTGFYGYLGGMTRKYGDAWIWTRDGLGLLENNRWYCIEQYVRLNTPGKADGVLRGWVDGKPAFEKNDIRFRDIPDLKVQFIWINLYQGGKWTAETDHHLYMDHLVIARRYIGPMKK